jgi:hypothetical protein
MPTVKEWFFKIWKDPVWSKLIAETFKSWGPIIIPVVAATIWRLIDKDSAFAFVNFLLKFLLLPLPLYVSIGLFILYLLVKKYNNRVKDPILKEQSTQNFTFKQLYDILSKNFLIDKTPEMIQGDMDRVNDNLLILFYQYSNYLGRGITVSYPGIEIDGNYGWAILAPKLVSYSIVYKKGDGELPAISNVSHISYHYTEGGIKFFSQLERYFSNNPGVLEKLRTQKYKSAN